MLAASPSPTLALGPGALCLTQGPAASVLPCSASRATPTSYLAHCVLNLPLLVALVACGFLSSENRQEMATGERGWATVPMGARGQGEKMGAGQAPGVREGLVQLVGPFPSWAEPPETGELPVPQPSQNSSWPPGPCEYL